MNIAAALALQSIPFAILVLATGHGDRDAFLVGYTAALGLILSMIVMWDGALLPLPAGLGLSLPR